MSVIVEGDTMTVHGRMLFGRREVTAAELLAATPPGLLVLDPAAGALLEIEAGAVLRGVQLLDYPDGDGGTVDITAALGPELAANLMIVCQTAAGLTVMNEDLSIAAEHRLMVMSGTGGLDADGAIGRNQIFVTYSHLDSRWRVPWSAP